MHHGLNDNIVRSSYYEAFIICNSWKIFSVSVYGARQQPYSLTRNKSDGQILKQRSSAFDQAEKYSTITAPDFLHDSPEELGYVSDVCDYNVQQRNDDDSPPASGVVHGTLSLGFAGKDKSIKVKDETGKSQKSEGFIVKPFPNNNDTSSNNKKILSEDEPDSQLSQYSRQSSVEQDSKADSKSKRKSSGGKSSAIKNKIQMRKMMREANKMERPTGTLSDDHDNDDGNDSVEEKQDSEPIVDDEIKNSNKTLRPPVETAQLTPETERRMKDWNSRFSNLKHSFDPSSDREDEPQR